MGLFSSSIDCELCGTKTKKSDCRCVGSADNPCYYLCFTCLEKLIENIKGSDVGYPKDKERAKRILADPVEGRRFRQEIEAEREKSYFPCAFCGVKITDRHHIIGERSNPDYKICVACNEKLVKNMSGWGVGYPRDKERGKLVASDPEEARRFAIETKFGEGDECVHFFETKTALLKAYEDYVVIIRYSGLLDALTTGIRGDKTLYYSDITAIQYKKPVGLLSGYIQFTLAGGREGTRGTNEAINDENSIVVPAVEDDYAIASERIVEYMHERLRVIKSGKGSTIINNVTSSSADEILKYKQLLDAGIITQEEFDAKKKQLLGL